MNETNFASHTQEILPTKEQLVTRAALGLIQGALLYFLFEAARSQTWPATEGLILAPSLLTLCLVPLVMIAGCTQLPRNRLILWSLVLTLILIGFGYHDIARGVEPAYAMGKPNHFPSALVSFFGSILVFIAYSLISAGETEQRWMAKYETYFDISWKLAVQLQFSTLFVAAFWMLLWAGAALFQLIGLGFFSRLLRELWFAVPATTLAITAAIHLTDVRPGIVRSIRTLLLTLQSWLLPLLTLIVGGFLVSIPLTGLEKLWATRHAAALLLGVAAAIVILVNTTFQQGRQRDEVPFLLRHAARLACLFLIPLEAIAAYALWLRIAQYGLTTDRIIALACLLVAACYGVGYGIAALRKGPWLGNVARTNILTAYVVLAVLIALFTPLADPARISVNAQLAALNAGKITPEKFDYTYFRFETARYGREALEKLAKETQGPFAGDISERARKSLLQKNRWEREKTVLSRSDIQGNLHLKIPDTKLPEDFLATDWQTQVNAWKLPNCLTTGNTVCDAYLADFTGDSQPDILLMPATGRGVLFGRDTARQWKILAFVPSLSRCAGFAEALSAKNYRVVAPIVSDLEIRGQRIRLEANADNDEKCR